MRPAHILAASAVLSFCAPAAAAQTPALSPLSYRVDFAGQYPALVVYWNQTSTSTPASNAYSFVAERENGAVEHIDVSQLVVAPQPADGAAAEREAAMHIRLDGPIAGLMPYARRFLAQVCAPQCGQPTATRELVIDASVLRTLLDFRGQLASGAVAARPEVTGEAVPRADRIHVALRVREAPVTVVVEAVQNGSVRSTSDPIALYPVEGTPRFVQTGQLLTDQPAVVRVRRAGGDRAVLLELKRDYADQPLRTTAPQPTPTLFMGAAPKAVVEPDKIGVTLSTQNATRVEALIEHWDPATGTTGAQAHISHHNVAGAPNSAYVLTIPHQLAPAKTYRLRLIPERVYGSRETITLLERGDAAYVTFTSVPREFVKRVELAFEKDGLRFRAVTAGVPAELSVSPALGASVTYRKTSSSQADPFVLIPLNEAFTWIDQARAAGDNGVALFGITVEAKDQSGRRYATELGLGAMTAEASSDEKKAMKEFVDQLEAKRDTGTRIRVRDVLRSGVPLLFRLIAGV